MESIENELIDKLLNNPYVEVTTNNGETLLIVPSCITGLDPDIATIIDKKGHFFIYAIQPGKSNQCKEAIRGIATELKK